MSGRDFLLRKIDIDRKENDDRISKGSSGPRLPSESRELSKFEGNSSNRNVKSSTEQTPWCISFLFVSSSTIRNIESRDMYNVTESYIAYCFDRLTTRSKMS